MLLSWLLRRWRRLRGEKKEISSSSRYRSRWTNREIHTLSTELALALTFASLRFEANRSCDWRRQRQEQRAASKKREKSQVPARRGEGGAMGPRGGGDEGPEGPDIHAHVSVCERERESARAKCYFKCLTRAGRDAAHGYRYTQWTHSGIQRGVELISFFRGSYFCPCRIWPIWWIFNKALTKLFVRFICRVSFYYVWWPLSIVMKRSGWLYLYF